MIGIPRRKGPMVAVGVNHLMGYEFRNNGFVAIHETYVHEQDQMISVLVSVSVGQGGRTLNILQSLAEIHPFEHRLYGTFPQVELLRGMGEYAGFNPSVDIIKYGVAAIHGRNVPLDFGNAVHADGTGDCMAALTDGNETTGPPARRKAEKREKNQESVENSIHGSSGTRGKSFLNIKAAKEILQVEKGKFTP